MYKKKFIYYLNDILLRLFFNLFKMFLNFLIYYVGSNMIKVSVLVEKMFYLFKLKGLKCFYYVLKVKCILKSIRK